MSAWIYIRCDRCRKRHSSIGFPTKEDARERLARTGWTTADDDGDACPDCTVALREEARAEQPNPERRRCNRHDDCDEADATADAHENPRPDHCHDDECPDCFGD